MDGHEQWMNDLFEWSEYTNAKTGSQKYHSDFFPLSICCACIIIGRTQSILDNEANLDYYSQSLQMGPNGCLICFLSTILNFCFPLPVSPLFGCCIMCQRARIMDQFNIDGGIIELLKACCCSCSVFQQYYFMKEIQRRKLESFSRSSLMKSLIINQSDNNHQNISQSKTILK